MTIQKINFVSATKAQKVSQKSNVPAVPYLLIGKDGASETAIQFFPKGGARDIIQQGKKTQFIHFGLSADSLHFGIQILKDKKEYDCLVSKGVQCRILTKGVNVNGGYGISSIKKSVKNPNGLDFTDMATKYIGNLVAIDDKMDTDFHFMATMSKVE